MNNRGFTLVELLATIVILTAVMTIGAVSIVGIINNSKKKNYDLLIDNIKSAAEMYYQECKFKIFDDDDNADDTVIACNNNNGTYTISLGNLVSYGFLKGNDRDNQSKYTIVNPNDNVSIFNCAVTVSYNNDSVVVDAVESLDNNSCPNHCDFFPKDGNCKKNG